MSDLISKKALVKAILAERDKHPLEIEERYSFGVKVPCRFNQALRGGIRKCLHLIEIAPTIDAEPIRHGHWIMNKSNFTCKCSNCGHSLNLSSEMQIFLMKDYEKYCYYCGAKMDEN